MSKTVSKTRISWQDINWEDANTKVLKLQMGIASAFKSKDIKKVIALQEHHEYLLKRSAKSATTDLTLTSRKRTLANKQKRHLPAVRNESH